MLKRPQNCHEIVEDFWNYCIKQNVFIGFFIDSKSKIPTDEEFRAFLGENNFAPTIPYDYIRVVKEDCGDILKAILKAHTKKDVKLPFAIYILDESIEFVLDAYPLSNLSNKTYSIDIFEAIGDGDIEILKILIKNGEDVNSKNKYGDTPLIISAQSGREDFVKLLVLSGAKLDLGGYNGCTALHRAAQNKFLNIVKYLVYNGSDIGKKDLHKSCVLHKAASGADEQMVRFLVEVGANINDQDADFNTPLHIAIVKKNIDAIKTLVLLGANLDIQNIFGENPIKLAQKLGYLNIAKFLIQSQKETNSHQKEMEKSQQETYEKVVNTNNIEGKTEVREPVLMKDILSVIEKSKNYDLDFKTILYLAKGIIIYLRSEEEISLNHLYNALFFVELNQKGQKIFSQIFGDKLKDTELEKNEICGGERLVILGKNTPKIPLSYTLEPLAIELQKIFGNEKICRLR